MIVARVAALLDDGAAYRLADGTGDIYFGKPPAELEIQEAGTVQAPSDFNAGV